ncbi:Ribosome biogenesis ATPase rix7 [Tieghemiomyces parasiticus]|uniref:Ribosome biogenesis ATPase rix7 n=1 Tax=Tieghemiomyces parasiticus TaxID=78921 RepID=A0A9W7ZWY0_9FUNG|nr:Ribosome biogenesis ATPase rix7 [Tieghemiomyces parasiticus]
MATNGGPRKAKSLNKALMKGWPTKPVEPSTVAENLTPSPAVIAGAEPSAPVAAVTGPQFGVSGQNDAYLSPGTSRAGIRFFQVPPPDPAPAPVTAKNKAAAEKPDTKSVEAGSATRGKRTNDAEDPERRKKTAKEGTRKNTALTETTVRLADVGGVDACIEEVLEYIAMPLLHPEVYLFTGVPPPRGILLHGPPGCGKTLLANAIAGELGVPFLQISAPSVVSGMSGESEKKIRDVFSEARVLAPCLLFIDEIDAITPKRETAQREMERRIVAQLLTCLDDLAWEKTGNRPVLIIGATNRADALDPALRRAGRFDREISMTVPDERARESILRVQCGKLRLAGDFDFKDLAKKTPGYVGADLNALTSAAGMIAVKRIFQMLKEQPAVEDVAEAAMDEDSCELVPAPAEEAKKPVAVEGALALARLASSASQSETDQLSSIAHFLRTHPEPLTEEELAPLAISAADFDEALGKVQPSSKREGFATVPDVTWEDIGALMRVRDELRMAVVEPIRHPDYFARVGITAPAGVLLWGPPGCGKTLLAKAVANESHTNFISVKGPELLNKYVGESERAVRQVFARARASSPCVVFFDELDALCGRRDENQSEASARVVNTLLTELDGMEARKQVFIIAATNRPDMIDPAMLRPGRLDKLLYVELPTAGERLEILRTLTRKTPLHPTEVSLEVVANHSACDGLSGADLASLVREAAVAALREAILVPTVVAGKASSAGASSAVLDFKRSDPANILITQAHFETAFGKIAPSVSKVDRANYQRLRTKFGLAN